MSDKKYTLECNGIQLKTNYWMPISDEEYEKARHDYFDLPPFEDVIRQLKNISFGGTKVNLITHYYFRDLMSNRREDIEEMTFLMKNGKYQLKKVFIT